MTELLIVLIVLVGWVGVPIVAAGWLYAQEQGTFPRSARQNRRSDIAFVLGLCSVLGPLSLPFGFFCSGFAEYGWALPWGARNIRWRGLFSDTRKVSPPTEPIVLLDWLENEIVKAEIKKAERGAL